VLAMEDGVDYFFLHSDLVMILASIIYSLIFVACCRVPLHIPLFLETLRKRMIADRL